MVQQSISLKILIFPLSLVITVAMAIFFIKPAFTEMTTVKSSLNDKSTQLENLKSQNQKLQSIVSKWESLAAEKTLVSSAFPEVENVDSYVSELTAKASRSGILLTDIKMAQKNGMGATTEENAAYLCGASSGGSPSSAAVPAVSQTAGTVQPPAGAPGGAVSGSEATSGSISLPSSCLNPVGISLKATGSWEQILDFFKYLEDMNRISNIDSITLSKGNQSQNQASSDLLTADISANAFFKEKSQGGNAMLASSLASQGNINQKSMDKLKEVIYSPYDVPAVSPSGERNIFK